MGAKARSQLSKYNRHAVGPHLNIIEFVIRRYILEGESKYNVIRSGHLFYVVRHIAHLFIGGRSE